MFGLHKSAKRFFAAAAACVIVSSLMPVNAFAATTVTYDVYTYRNPEVDRTSAVVTGQAYTSPSGYEVEYGVAYSTTRSDSSPYVKAATRKDSYDDFEVTISGLKASTTYYYRAYITYYRNTSGSSTRTEYGEERSFTTLSSSSSSSSSSTSSSTTDAVVNPPRITSVSGTEAIAESSYVSNGNTVSYAGFVYSSTNPTPTRSDADLYDQVSEANKTFTKRLTSLSRNTTYYVRAYISVSTNNYASYNDIYSSVTTFVASNSGSALDVYTRSVSNVNNTGADVTISVTNSGSSTIAERGVVYSISNTLPELYSSNAKYKIASGTTGETTVTLTDLEQGSTYYARAYAFYENNASTVYYGDTKSFVTVNDTTVVTNDMTSVSSASAVANGRISDVSTFNLEEKGFVYSRTEQKPTLNDSKASTTMNNTGSYSLEITGLEPSTTYYVRAYAKTYDSVSYGNAVTFTTGDASVTLNVTYRALNGSSVGQETVTATAGQTLYESDLKQIPAGYSLQNTSWSHRVTAPENITVAVVQGSGTSVSTSGAFMDGVGNYMFAPDRAATRAEVAEAIYALAGKPSGTVGMSFSDVPANHTAKDAINYVSSKSYMQGYPDGTFKPAGNITRAEVCVILNMMYSTQVSSTTTAFKDIEPTDWHYKYIAMAYNNQMIYGFEDGTFKPNNTTTRAQICTMLSNSEKRTLTPLGTAQFTDVPASHWAYQYIMNAAVPRL